MERIQRIREALNWSQAAMGEFLRQSQRAVWAIEKRKQEETGPVTTLLDLLEGALAAGRVSDGMSPAAAREAIESAVARHPEAAE